MRHERGFSVAWGATPFGGRVHRTMRRAGPSIAELVASLPDLPPHFATHGVVCVNAEPVPRHLWAHVRPKPKRAEIEVMVTLHIRPSGGGLGGSGGSSGGSSKNILTTVAAIAVVAAAAFVSGGALVPLLGAGFAAGTTGATVAAAAVSLGGALLVSALSPPPTAQAADAGSTLGSQAGADPDRGVASLSGNLLRAGAPVPRVVGTHRVFPPLLAPPLIETVGDEEYAEAVFGLAGPHQLQDLRMGSIPINEMDEVDVEISEGLPGSVLPSLVNRQSHTEEIQLEVTAHKVQTNGTSLEDQTLPDASLPRWHRLVTRDSPDEFWIRLQWPRGLFDENQSTALGLPMRLRMRLRGDEAWINLPEVHFQHRRLAALQRMIKIRWATAPTVPPTPTGGAGFYLAYIVVPGQSAVSPATSGWTADAHFDANSGGPHYVDSTNVSTSDVRNLELYPDHVEIFMDPGTNGVWEVEIILGMPYEAASNFTASTYTINSVVYDLFGYYLSGSTARINQNVSDNSYATVLPSVSSVWNEHPVQSPDFSVIAMRVYNRQLSELSVLASGYVNIWDGSTWETLSVSSNPADWFRDILCGPLAAESLPLDLLDEANILAWRAHCETQGYEVNAVVEGRSASEALQMVAACGYARPRQSENWGVIIDRDRSEESPVQMFSPRNMQGFRWEKGFARLPDGLTVSFRNSGRDYEGDEIIVLDPEQDSGGVRLESITYDGLVTEEEATARALFDMAQGRHRMAFYYGRADVENIICRRGDLVAVQHDTIDRRAGFARIKAVETDGGSPELLTAIVLDGSVPHVLDNYYLPEEDESSFYLAEDDSSLFYQDPEYGVAIQASDGSQFVKQVTGDEDDETFLEFVTPFEDADGLIVPGAHVVTGALGREYSRKIIFNIEPREDLTADLTFVDEAPEIFA